MVGSWLERFDALLPIQCRDALHFYSARDRATGAPRVVVVPPPAMVALARERLARLARAHRLAAGSCVPDVADAELHGTSPFVALACDGIADQSAVADYIRHGGERPDFLRASAFGKQLMETLSRAHDLVDPETDGPLVLGSLAPSNVLFSATGKLWLVGFGAGPFAGATIAPEVALGAAPTPGADVYAFVAFIRSQMSLVRLPDVMRRLAFGKSLARDAKLALLFAWSNMKVLIGPADARPTMKQTLARARQMWRALGIEPDVDGFERWIEAALANGSPLASAPPRATPRDDGPRATVVGNDAEWIVMPDGSHHTLRARGPLRRIVLALATAHRDRPRAVVSSDELLSAAWPGETPIPEAASNRVYVAISTLRKMGFGPVLQRADGGYRIDPETECRFESERPATSARI